jgi:rubredoxin
LCVENTSSGVDNLGMPSVESQAVAIQKPDWPNIKDDILCPLCDYNLRGLDKPRCPECGYSFEWNDLLDPTRRRHPYSFEHHPHRNFWSFRKTLVGGLRPAVFWKKLHPTQPSRVGRLLIYYFLTALITMLIPMAFMGIGMIYFAGVMQQLQVSTLARLAGPNGAALGMSPQQWVAPAYPLPPRLAVLAHRPVDAHVPQPFARQNRLHRLYAK